MAAPKAIGAALGLALAYAMTSPASATADGPDHFRVSGVAPGGSLNLRSGPSLEAERIGRIPAGTDGLRNLGCRGGMDFATWQKADPAQREAARRTRWCRVSWHGIEGWVAGWYLAEGAAPRTPVVRPPAARPIAFAGQPPAARVDDEIAGYQIVDYVFDADPGQVLWVSMQTDHPASYFNVLPPDSEAAIFIGSTAGSRFGGTLRQGGRYTVRVYLMRSAARRGERASYTLDLTLAP